MTKVGAEMGDPPGEIEGGSCKPETEEERRAPASFSAYGGSAMPARRTCQALALRAPLKSGFRKSATAEFDESHLRRLKDGHERWVLSAPPRG
jgi:hypothetical protein